MPKFKISYSELHRVKQTVYEEFDTSSKEQWEQLKEKARDRMDPYEFDELPIKPPKTPEDWMRLYKFVDVSEYSNSEKDDWLTLINGGHEMSWVVTDKSGKIIMEDD